MPTIEIEVEKEAAERVRAVLQKPISAPWTKADKSVIAGVLIAVVNAYAEQAFVPAVGDRVDIKDRGFPWSELEKANIEVIAVVLDDPDDPEVVVKTTWGDYVGYFTSEYDFRKA